jgi:4-phospho-D-threonate 3-dehydrogenase / 4-phospho-D-erythronate 3-dehydrogenase
MIPHLTITMGDPAGIGPEIIVKACAKLAPRIRAGELSLLVLGDVGSLRRAETILDAPNPIPEWAGDGPVPPLAVEQCGPRDAKIPFGEVAAAGGRVAYLAIERAVRLAQDDKVQAIVTAPLNKEALNLAGYHYPGHTELLAELTGTKGSVMMLAHDGMHVSHVTTHCALEDVPKRMTPERIRRVIDVTHDALKRLGVTRARIAIAALNPHAGEGGLFGRQDIDVTAPIVADYVARGFDVVGPIPGDTVFVKLRGGQYDAVVAMYHDQGHIPVKLMGFKVDPVTGKWNALNGVNITLGLPIIRTSVDHGTAFDIAGQGIASETSLIEAIEYAERLAAARS